MCHRKKSNGTMTMPVNLVKILVIVAVVEMETDSNQKQNVLNTVRLEKMVWDLKSILGQSIPVREQVFCRIAR